MKCRIVRTGLYVVEFRFIHASVLLGGRRSVVLLSAFKMMYLFVAFILATSRLATSQTFSRPILPPRPPPQPLAPQPGGFSRPSSSLSSGGSFNSNQNSRTQTSRRSLEALVSNSVQELALDLSYEQWSQGNAGNMIHSPLSIGSLLSLLMLGSKGSSYEELKSALFYPQSTRDETIHQAYKTVIENLNQGVPGVDIKMSSNLFLQKGLSIMGGFTQNAQQHYKAGATGVDFRARPREAMRAVNSVVSRATERKIPEIVKQPFSPETSFVAVNTIFFNGLWDIPFDKRATYEGTFNTGSRNISIPMMVNEMEVPYLSSKASGIEMIALPYKGGKYSMYIMSPRGNNGITSLINMEHGLDALILNSLINLMTPQKISVTIPRMSMRQRFSLKADLQRLGVTSIFGPSADFGRMTSQPGAFIDQVIHEAVLEMTETGTVAAAATLGSTDRILVKRFALDKPSLMFIRDNTNGLILFWCRLVEPTPLRT